jgi:cytochrome c oxidase assembly factor CtaG
VRLAVAVPLAIAIALFLRGAWHLRTCRRAGIGAARLVAAAVGFTALGVALSDTVHAAGHTLFTAHMAQHLLLVSLAAPALLLADPVAVTLWALPRRARRTVGRLLVARHPVRRLLAQVTRMRIAGPAYALVLWAWHIPGPYEAALRSGMLHDVEHLVFFGAALLFWWPVLRPGPRLAPAAHPATRVAYLVLGALQGAALGLLLASRGEPLYASYAATAPAWGWSAAEDQAMGGLLMWTVGSAVDMIAVLVVVAQALGSASFLDHPEALRDNWSA